jgi:anoctamin-10
VFNSKKQNEFLQLVRNFYGERVSFYFLFLNHYISWLTFPTFLGLVVFIMYLYKSDLSSVNPTFNLSTMNITFTAFACLLILWVTLFLKVWKQQEKLFSYFWGTENFEQEEAFDDKFQSDFNSIFLFNFHMKFQHNYKKFFKYFISYSIVILFVNFFLK